MSDITIEDIQHDPQGFLHRVKSGETLVIYEEDRPVAEIKPLPAMESKKHAPTA